MLCFFFLCILQINQFIYTAIKLVIQNVLKTKLWKQLKSTYFGKTAKRALKKLKTARQNLPKTQCFVSKPRDFEA